MSNSPWAASGGTVTPAGASATVVTSTGTAGNASLLNGFVQSVAAVANTIALRDALGGLAIAALAATSIACSGPITGTTATLSGTIASNIGGWNITAGGAAAFGGTVSAAAFSVGVTAGNPGTNIALKMSDGANATANISFLNNWTVGSAEWIQFNVRTASAVIGTALTLNSDTSATFAASVAVNGLLQIATSNGNYNEGIRIVRSSSNSYATIQLGADSSGAGQIANQWSIANTPTGVLNIYNSAATALSFQPTGAAAFAISASAPYITASSTVSAYGMLRVNCTSTAEASMSFSNNNSGPGVAGSSPGGNVWGLGLGVAGIGANFGLFNGSLGANAFTVAQATSNVAFAGQVQIAASKGLYLASGAPSTTTDCLYQVSDQPYWNGFEVLTMGNLNNTAAALMATQAQVLAPQWVASLPTLPNSQYPAAFWDATNGLYQGGYVCIISSKAMYQNQGGSWVSVGVSQGIFGKIVAGQISAASVGTTALATQLALVGQYISSQAFNSGATSAQISGGAGSGWGIPAYSGQQGLPIGWAVYSTGIVTTCYNGDPTNASGVWTTPNVQAEFGAGISLGGYDLSGLSIGKLLNGGYKECIGAGTYTWICPPNITKLTITLCAGGAGGGATNSGGGGAGGTILAVLTVVPLNKYTIIVGPGGATATAGSDSSITNTTTSTTILTAKGGLASATAGVAGQGGASCSLFSDGGLPGSNGVRTPPTVSSLAIFNTFTADGKTHHILQVCPGAGGGANISGASQTGGMANSGYVPGGAPSSAGGGGSSAMGVGGYGAASGTNPGQAGQGYGSGGGGGISAGAYTGGAGAPGYALLQW